MAKKVWGQSEPEEAPEPEAVAQGTYGVGEIKTNATHAHVHEWTVYPSGKRKCKPCGTVERSG